MKPSEEKKLRKQYPADKFNVIKSRDGLIISPKKATVRVYKATALDIIKGNATERIETMLKTRKLTKESFAQSQLTITEELKKRLDQETTKCKTRRIIYLQRLLE